MPFSGRPAVGEAEDVLTGFLDSDGKARSAGRSASPIDKAGALLVADDVGNAVWRVTPAAAKAASALPSTAR